MKDIGSRRNEPACAVNEFRNPKVVSWPSKTVIDPGSSPWKAGKTNKEVLDYASDPEKPEELLRLNNPDSADFSKP